MLKFFRYMAACASAYRIAQETKMAYSTVKVFGVVQVAVFVALDREAWRLAKFAADCFETEVKESREI